MPSIAVRSIAASIALTLTLAACASTGPDTPLVWGSDQAGLTLSTGGATLQILASGGCYGSFGEISGPVPPASFSLPGTYTQLTGVAPGSVQYDAQFDGTVEGRHLTLRITIPALAQTVGPFSLTQGIAKTWPACRYP